MFKLVDQVTTPQGHVPVITKTRFYFFFTRPRTSVMPFGLSKFGRQLGFQAIYNTSDPKILAELHRYWVVSVAVGEFRSLLTATKTGSVRLSKDFEHLQNYIIGFRS